MAELSSNRNALYALSSIHLLAMESMYGMVFRNGYISALSKLRREGPYVLPGSQVPILTKFTGISPLDKLLTLANVMFCNITDGSAPHFSLYAFHFGGQLVPVITAVMIEGIRSGNSGGIMSLWVPWLCAMQATGFGFVMPLYGMIHLWRSGTAGKRSSSLLQSVRIKDEAFVDNLVTSVVAGYFLPTALMAFPVPSDNLHQWLGGLWQGFPVWIWIFQYIIRYAAGTAIRRKVSTTSDTRKNLPRAKCKMTEMRIIHRTYLFAFGVSATTHLMSVGLIILRKMVPSQFSARLQEALTFSKVFIPPFFHSGNQMTDMASAIQNFFQYDQYVGSLAAITWASALWYNAQKSPINPKRWLWLAGELFGISVFAGPGAALMTLLWKRDEELLSDDNLD